MAVSRNYWGQAVGGELVAWVEANYKTSVQRFHSGYSAVNPAAAWKRSQIIQLKERILKRLRQLKAAIQFRACVVTLAKLAARNKVKEQIRARGEKVSHYCAREISIMADDYLNDPAHREALIENARVLATQILAKSRRRPRSKPERQRGQQKLAPFSFNVDGRICHKPCAVIGPPISCCPRAR